jgi:ubiquinone/menaquinone biosynthesis C-methylase UbiE
MMDAKLQRRVQRYGWDKAAASYERFWQAQLAPAQRRLLELAALQPGERVLDIACGTGLVTFPAAGQVGASGKVVATDISDAMVTGLREQAARRGLGHVSAARMDAETLDLPDGSMEGNDLALHFGLGRASVSQLRVVWPDGTEHLLDDIAFNQIIQVTYPGLSETLFAEDMNP